MHPSQHAASTWSPLQPSQRADRFSFPPTQRNGLLVSPADLHDDTSPDADHDDEPHRSTNQQKNLQHSLDRLLDSIDHLNPRAVAV
ncbi:hypothetical protein [Collinsella tanakaei]|nr:hypothetical protein [Collinsella tanakaei]MCF2621536.1 hypothetical protein [Collinsella tanakaei]